MKKIVIVLLSMLILLGCVDFRQKKVTNLLQEWSGRKIHFPSDMVFTIQGKDTVDYNINGTYKLLTYIDSLGCTSCKLKISEWKILVDKFDSIYPDSVRFLFFFYPKRTKDMYNILRGDKFNYPVCIDKKDSLNKLNHFPLDIRFQTFLLDKDNKVLAIGNPVHNPKVKELYMKIIQGKEVVKEENSLLTKLQVKENTISFGRFNWQDEQKVQFMIYNVGKHPLVINDVTTSCGCTYVDYSKQPIHPGDSISLQVAYKADHPEHFDKTITVYCNTNPSLIHLKITGDAE